MQERFPALFQPARWHETTNVAFALWDDHLPVDLISNVNLVPYTAQGWVVMQTTTEQTAIPGGTREPGEDYLLTLRRELREEIGAVLHEYFPVGAWRCYNDTAAPYRPHMPHPLYYRVVYCGRVELVAPPTNPPDAEQILQVETLPLEIVVQRFRAAGRDDLADLYALAAEFRAKSL